MPQELHCVQCCDCGVFQSQIVKKVPEFSCALCGTKQSVRQVYAQSNRGKEVRLVVQRLNAKRGRQEEAAERAPLTAEGPVPGAEAPRNTVGMGEDWTAYIAAKAEAPEPTDGSDVDDRCLVTCLPEQHQRKRQTENDTADTSAFQPQTGENWQQTGGERDERRPHAGGRAAAARRHEPRRRASISCANQARQEMSPRMPLQQHVPDFGMLMQRAGGASQRDACGDGEVPSVHSGGPSAAPQLGRQPAQEQHLGGAVRLQPATAGMSEGSRHAGVPHAALAELPLRGSVASRWQRFAPPPSLTSAGCRNAVQHDYASRTAVTSDRTEQANGVCWDSWLPKRDVVKQPAVHLQSAVVQRASAWHSPADGKQNMQHSTATFVTTAL